jgi:hypothetical protein
VVPQGETIDPEKEDAPHHQSSKALVTQNPSSFTVQGSPELKRKRAPIASAILGNSSAVEQQRSVLGASPAQMAAYHTSMSSIKDRPLADNQKIVTR